MPKKLLSDDDPKADNFDTSRHFTIQPGFSWRRMNFGKMGKIDETRGNKSLATVIAKRN